MQVILWNISQKKLYLKKRNNLISYMKHISWITLGVTSIVVIGFILYFILPHPAYPSSELSEEESKWVDQRPKVEQSFIDMYDSLSTETVASFIQDWQKWSANRLLDATDTLVNRLYQLSLLRYTSNSIKLDSAQYVVRDYYLEIYRSEESYTENKDLDSYVFTDTLFVVPPSIDDRGVLYVTPEIDQLLEAYLNWVEQRDLEKESVLSKFIPVRPGSDIPGYYSFRTYPSIYRFRYFNNCTIVEISPNPYEGDIMVLPNNDIEKASIHHRWII